MRPRLERLDEEGVGDTQNYAGPNRDRTGEFRQVDSGVFRHTGELRCVQVTHGAWVLVVYSLNSLSWMVK